MEKFSQMPYRRPDLAAAKALIETTAEKIRSAQTAKSALEAHAAYRAESADLETMYTLASIRNTMNTLDEYYEGEMNFFNENLPALSVAEKAVSAAILESPFVDAFREAYGELWLRNLRVAQRLADEKIVPEQIEQAKLCQEYSKTVAACETEFRGENCNFYALLKHMQSADREERREAFLAWSRLYESVSDKLDEQYSALVALRCRMAEKLGYKNYIEMAYEMHSRYDYTPQDVAAFRDEVRRVITPLCEKLYEQQRKRLGVDKLHWYDEALVFPQGNPTPHGTMEQMVDAAQKMYRSLSPQTGEFFDFMKQYELFDLCTRPGKHMGGYCTYLPAYGAPFIFSNFNGTSADVDVLTHKAGHAFEAFTAAKCVPTMDLIWSTSEINEIHSMTMELLTYPYMDLFFGEDAENYRYAHLCDCLCVIPYLCCVDEYQHKVFEHPEMTPAQRRAAWRESEKSLMPWRDYEGSDFLQNGGFWMQKQHIFLYPFYYIDYALAQLCAFRLNADYCKDRESGWQRYLALCRSGGTKGYFETLRAAGLRPLFEKGAVEEAIAPVAQMLHIDME